MAPYIPSGKSVVIILPSVASPAAPTQLEIDAGFVITEPNHVGESQLKEMEGWETDRSDVEIPNVATKFTSTIPGRGAAGSGTMTFYDSDAVSNAVRSALEEDSTQYVLIAKAGLGTGKRAEIWPTIVSTINDSQVNSEATASTFMVRFSQYEAPTKDAVLP
jgi:hypothetical protein